MPALPTLRPSSYVSGSLVATTTVGNVNDSSDATYIESQSGNGVDGYWIYEIDDVPSDLSAVDSAQVTVTIRCAVSATGDDTWGVRPVLVDTGGTIVSNTPAYSALNIGTTAVQQFTFTLTKTGANTRAAWNAVRLELGYTNAKVKGNDGNTVRIMDAWADGTYTQVVGQSFAANLLAAPESVLTPSATTQTTAVAPLLGSPATVLPPSDVTTGPVSAQAALLEEPAVFHPLSAIPGPVVASAGFVTAPPAVLAPADVIPGETTVAAERLVAGPTFHGPETSTGPVSATTGPLTDSASFHPPGSTSSYVAQALLLSDSEALLTPAMLLAEDAVVEAPHLFV